MLFCLQCKDILEKTDCQLIIVKISFTLPWPNLNEVVTLFVYILTIQKVATANSAITTVFWIHSRNRLPRVSTALVDIISYKRMFSLPMPLKLTL